MSHWNYRSRAYAAGRKHIRQSNREIAAKLSEKNLPATPSASENSPGRVSDLTVPRSGKISPPSGQATKEETR